MTDAEYIKTIPTLTNKELLEELDYCGYDSYYRTIREPVIEEITKRLNRIAELEEENAELKKSCKIQVDTAFEMIYEKDDQLTKAKEIIKDYMIIVKGDHTTVCGVSEENRCINVLKLNEQAEQFLKE